MDITALLCVYNGANYLRAAIDSVLQQTRPIDELLVVDDGSTDGTAAILASYGDSIRVIRHAGNRGLGAARCTGLAAVRTELVAFHDADDLWTPRKNELTMQVFAEYPDCQLVFGDMMNFDDATGEAQAKTALESATSMDMCVAHEVAHEIHEISRKDGEAEAEFAHGKHGTTRKNDAPALDGFDGFPASTNNKQPTTNNELLRLAPDKLLPALILNCFFHIPTITVRVDAVREAGGFDQDFRRAQDVDLWYRLAALGVQCYGVPQTFLRRRLHGANLIGDSYTGDLFQARAMARHVERFGQYPPVLRKQLFQRLQSTQRHAAMGALRDGRKEKAQALLKESYGWHANMRDLALLAATLFPRGMRRQAGRAVQRLTGRHVANG